jgi:hypothetical protein
MGYVAGDGVMYVMVTVAVSVNDMMHFVSLS